MRLVGVDVGGTDTKLGVFDEELRCLRSWKIPTDRSEGGRHIMENAARSMTEELGGAPDAVGIGVPGLVVRGHVVVCVDAGWADSDPALEIQERLGCPAAAANDANVAALGEYLRGAGQGVGSLLLITLGTGVGGGIVRFGRLEEGAHGFAGEIGHIPVDTEERENCNCGQRGCLDQVASATGILRRTRRLLHTGVPSMLRDTPDLRCEDVFRALRAEDPVAVEVIHSMARFLARAMVRAGMLLDPELFLLGGGVAGAGDILLEIVREKYREETVFEQGMARIELATLGNQAGMTGAAALALRALEKS